MTFIYWSSSVLFFFFKQKTAYEMRISDWSSDVCSSDLKQPKLVRKVIRRLTMKQLPQDYPVDVHFKPTYGPWDQRLCLVPNGDLFRAIRKIGRASCRERVGQYV